VRRIAVRTVLPARLAENWPGLQQICRIERFRETKQLGSRQVIYAITDLPVLPGSAAALLALARGHWQIENRLFHVRDTTFAEDACRVRSGNAPAALAHLRDASLTLIRKRNLKPKPAREAFAANPRAAIRAILTS
jgi:predicted transposase YbfD/YdcC